MQIQNWRKNQTTIIKKDAYDKFSATAIARLAELEKIIGEYEKNLKKKMVQLTKK